MKVTIPIPEDFPDMTVKELLEEYFLVPRKIRHFLRIKKHVLLNGRSVHWQSQVSTHDVLTLLFDQEDYPEKEIPFGDASLVEELYQDEHMIIVNKPEGMKTHANETTEIALLNHVAAYTNQTCYVVHRLDKETSGAILFAKNPFILPILNRLLEKKEITRTYLALVEGTFPQTEVIYTDPIGRDRHDRRKRIVDPKKGRTAETHVSIVAQGKKRTLVCCQLKTGRTHQIRVHLSHHRHAIIGDPLYQKQATSRLMLHAQQLSLTHPLTLEKIETTAKSVSFEEGVNPFMS